MPRRLKLSRLQAAAALAEAEITRRENEPFFMCIYRRGPSSGLFGPAKAGDADAQFELGRLYFEGRPAQSHDSHYGKDGKDCISSYTPAFERHYPLAMKWLQQAADQGHEEARQLLEVVKLHAKDGVH